MNQGPGSADTRPLAGRRRRRHRRVRQRRRRPQRAQCAAPAVAARTLRLLRRQRPRALRRARRSSCGRSQPGRGAAAAGGASDQGLRGGMQHGHRRRHSPAACAVSGSAGGRRRAGAQTGGGGESYRAHRRAGDTRARWPAASSRRCATSLARSADFVLQPCDGLAHAIEADDATKIIALCARYTGALGTFGTDPGQIDTLVLGCTHYPLAAEALRRFTGESVRFFDTGEPVARRAHQLLAAANQLRHNGEGSVRLMASAGAMRWNALPRAGWMAAGVRRLLGRPPRHRQLSARRQRPERACVPPMRRAVILLVWLCASSMAGHAACDSGLAERLHAKLHPGRTLDHELAVCQAWRTVPGRSIVVLPLPRPRREVRTDPVRPRHPGGAAGRQRQHRSRESGEPPVRKPGR